MLKYFLPIAIVFCCTFCVKAQQKTIDSLYLKAYEHISNMLDGKEELSVKKAVYWTEWAYLDGNLDYEEDFNKEIVRIADYIKQVIQLNHFEKYKTAKQFSLCNYFFRPCNGNDHNPYRYNTNESLSDNDWKNQLTSRTLKTHTGNCRSLPWTFKLIAEELGAEAYITYAPRHCFIMYKDEDDHYPEDWVNVELTNQTYTPTFSIKDFYSISDSAIVAGTYLTPLDNRQTVARQLSDLAMGYLKKNNNHYSQFTLDCVQKSLQYHKSNPNAILIMGKSLEALLWSHLQQNGGLRDDYTDFIDSSLIQCERMLADTHWTPETDELRSRWTNNGNPAPQKQIITREMYNQMKQNTK